MRMERVCRPDSVRRFPGVTVIRLGPRSPGGSSRQPARTEGRPSRREPHACLFGVAPGGVLRAVPVTGNAVGSYPTVSPLPAAAFAAPSAVCSLCHCPSPWARPEGRACCAWPLASTPPSGVRTFLPGIAAPATVRPAPDPLGHGRRPVGGPSSRPRGPGPTLDPEPRPAEAARPPETQHDRRPPSLPALDRRRVRGARPRGARDRRGVDPAGTRVDRPRRSERAVAARAAPRARAALRLGARRAGVGLALRGGVGQGARRLAKPPRRNVVYLRSRETVDAPELTVTVRVAEQPDSLQTWTIGVPPARASATAAPAMTPVSARAAPAERAARRAPARERSSAR